MASNKACYWLALAVLVLGVSSEYRQGRLEPVEHVVNRSVATFNCLAGRAHEYVSFAKALMTPAPKASPEVWAQVREVERNRREWARAAREAALAHVDMARVNVNEAEFARIGTEIARHQAEFARIQAEQARMVVKARQIRKNITCKDGMVRVTVDSDGDPDAGVAAEVVDTF